VGRQPERAPHDPARRVTTKPAAVSGHSDLSRSWPLNRDNLLALQRTVGNQAVAALLTDGLVASQPVVQRRAAAASLHPAWTEPQLWTIQKQLHRLGLYVLKPDGVYGRRTRAALVEAFGGDDWLTLTSSEMITRLSAATPPSGAKGEHRLRYGEMFKDGVLDMTVAIGFDEHDADSPEIAKITAWLAAKGWAADPGAARSRVILLKGGRTLEAAAYGHFYVKENALVYTPPAAPPRPIHAVLRLVDDPSGAKGGSAAEALEEGMTKSEVTFYAGHGRYGTGPDFDAVLRVELPDLGLVLEDYQLLEKKMHDEGKPFKRGAWGQFMWRVNHKKVIVTGKNLGNVFLNQKIAHAGEFGAQLLHWLLVTNKATAAPLQTGKKGPLAKAAAAFPERPYRVLVFDGCRTQDYVSSIAGTPGFDPRRGGADILATQRITYWSDKAAALAAFLDSIMGMQSAEGIIKEMNAQEAYGKEATDKKGRPVPAFAATGLAESPVIR